MRLDLDDYVHDIALRDGRSVRIRPIRGDDLDAMMEMWSRLSLDTVRLRFFAPRRMERDQMRHFTEVDYVDRFALVAARGRRLIGVSRFDRLPHDPDAAEFAVLVEDAEQGNGVGTVLLRSLLAPAQHLGIVNFKGSFLRDNRRIVLNIDDHKTPSVNAAKETPESFTTTVNSSPESVVTVISSDPAAARSAEVTSSPST